MPALTWAVVVGEALLLAYFFAMNAWQVLLLASAAWQMRKHAWEERDATRWWVLGSALAPRISLLVPAYDEEAAIADNVRALLGLDYPNLEVVVVNDGSSDRTVDVLIAGFDLAPVVPIFQRVVDTQPVRRLFRSRSHARLIVVDKRNGGKADALNAGLNVATGALVCAIDADTVIQVDALLRMVRPFIEDERVVAAGGTVRVGNGCVVEGGRVRGERAPRGLLARLQVVEYTRAFLAGRLGWNRLGGNLIISGAFGLFRRSAVMEIGGYADDTVGEDMELVLRLRRHAYDQRRPARVEFVPDPVAWTEAPETVRTLARQRNRWHRGLADVMWRHRRVAWHPRYGAMGTVVFPYFLLFELLAPLVEAFGIVALAVGLARGFVDVEFALLFFAVAYGFAMILGVATLLVDEAAYGRFTRTRDRAALLRAAVLEHVGYRQLTIVWRIWGLVDWLRGRRDWGAQERKGFAGAEAKDAAAA